MSGMGHTPGMAGGGSRMGRFSSLTKLRYEDIPDRAFLKALYLQSIVIARPVSISEKSRLPKKGVDVLIYSPFEGYSTYLDRNTVLNNFTYLDGSPIKLSAWKSKNKYQIKTPINKVYAAMMVPKGVSLTYQGKEIIKSEVKHSSYIICPYNEGGQVSRDEFRVISSTMFKRMFIMMPDEVIYMAKRGELKSQGGSRRIRNGSRITKPEIRQPLRSSAQMGVKEAPGPVRANAVEQKPRTAVRLNTGVGQIADEGGYVYRAVGRIVDYNSNLQFFVIEAIKSPGRRANIPKAKMVELCRKKQVENIMLYTATSNVNGVPKTNVTLRGNGIKISDLPIMGQV